VKMILSTYIVASAVLIMGIALAGLLSDRHFIAIMLGIELIFVADTILVIGGFSLYQSPNPAAVVMLVGIWAVAAVEIITLITFYVYMKANRIDFDVRKLSKLKW
jgi:NADH:ubiquinone oxidoreductase subunit K